VRILSIDNVKENMQLAKSIYFAEENTLLAEGTRLTNNFVEKLRALGVSTLYVTDKYSGKIDVDELVKTQTKKEAIKITKEVMTHIRKDKSWNVSLTAAKKELSRRLPPQFPGPSLELLMIKTAIWLKKRLIEI
jgi:hypothetical protein